MTSFCRITLHIIALNEKQCLVADALGTEAGSSWGSEGQTSPPSSCATPNSATDVPDAELTFTLGVTEGTPYPCAFCDKAFPRLSYLKKHEQPTLVEHNTTAVPVLENDARSLLTHLQLVCQARVNGATIILIGVSAELMSPARAQPVSCLIYTPCPVYYRTSDMKSRHRSLTAFVSIIDSPQFWRCFSR
ncbi:hypothetical protein J6590_029766 [Homalodisca vitripennis]|nr:hypothetical protein J6590_099084 [Homalodisca vitripennis]KAG8327010.1 hypothetical protein J6590_029766 [Homalodisca vitripennis]